MMAPKTSAAPIKEPITIPAIAPPDKPEAGWPDAEADALELEELVGLKSGGIEEKVGS